MSSTSWHRAPQPVPNCTIDSVRRTDNLQPRQGATYAASAKASEACSSPLAEIIFALFSRSAYTVHHEEHERTTEKTAATPCRTSASAPMARWKLRGN